MARIEQDIHEEEVRQRREAQDKRDQIENAERKRQAPVDDSQMVDEMFGFIDAQTDSSGEGVAPSAFKVIISSAKNHFEKHFIGIVVLNL